jgi:acyl-coenzyme A synthetase/AMP-(fatty) acid ligase
VKACIQLQPGRAAIEGIDSAALIDFTRERLAPFKVPRFIEFVDELPHTPSEKVAKHELLAHKGDQRSGAWDATTGAWG